MTIDRLTLMTAAGLGLAAAPAHAATLAQAPWSEAVRAAAVTPQRAPADPTEMVRLWPGGVPGGENVTVTAEVNEAFAVVAMIAMRDLNIPHDKLNVHGGATALGHPIGASGARVLATLLSALQARGGGKGMASLCIGGGEAVAMAVEMA